MAVPRTMAMNSFVSNTFLEAAVAAADQLPNFGQQ
jgi:hypothetical protein